MPTVKDVVRRWAILGVALALVAPACGGDDRQSAEAIAKLSADDVKPPPAVDSKRTGLPGLVLATNSPSLRRLANTPDGEGAVILFVEPGGPSDGLGIGRGDLITSVDGERVRNHARALALLHAIPRTKLEIAVTHRDGNERKVTIEPREPLVQSLRQYVNPLVAASPKDPILRFVRASSPGNFADRLADLEEALKLDKRFVEAMSLRASLIWDNRPTDEAERGRFVNAALDGWKDALAIDRDNLQALTTRSTVLSVLGNGAQARRDASKAIELDPTAPRAYYAEGVAQESLKRPQAAAGPARASIELDPFNVQHWRLLARVFTALKRKDDCRKTVNGFAPFLQAQGFDRDAQVLRSLCN